MSGRDVAAAIVGIAVGMLVIAACSGSQKAQEEQAVKNFTDHIDMVCALRDKFRDGGVQKPVITTDGCPADASDTYWNCTGK